MAELRRDLAAQREARESYERAADEERSRLRRLEDELSSTIARARRNQMAIVVRRLTHGALSRAFVPWKEGAALQRLREQAMLRVLNRIDKRDLAIAFATWKQRVASEKEKDEKEKEEEERRKERDERERAERERGERSRAELEEAIAEAELRATEAAARAALEDSERKAEEQREAQSQAEAARRERGRWWLVCCAVLLQSLLRRAVPSDVPQSSTARSKKQPTTLHSPYTFLPSPHHRSKEDPKPNSRTGLQCRIFRVGRGGCAHRRRAPCRCCQC